MSRVGRVTFVWIGVLLGILVLGVLWMLEALDTQLKPVCLDAVAPPPTGVEFVVSRKETADGTLRIVYDTGTTVEVPIGPKRIVSSLPGITEMIAYLGAEDRLVAVTEHCDYPPSVTALRRVSVLPFDAEGILEAKPDVVVIDRRLHYGDLDRIRLRCPAVLILDSSRSLDHLLHSMDLLQQVIGTKTAKVNYLQFAAQCSGVLHTLRTHAPKTPPRVLVVAQWEPLYALGRGSLIDDLIRLCGCVNVACDLKGDASNTFPEELVLARRPHLILTPAKPIPDRLRQRWKNVPAVKGGWFVDASRDDLVRAGPRILDALTRLAGELQGWADPPGVHR